MLMRLEEGNVTIAAAAFAIVGTLALFLLSESPQSASVAQAIVAQSNTLVKVDGEAANVTSEKFLLCQQVEAGLGNSGAGAEKAQRTRICISVRGKDLPASALLYEGKMVIVTGRVKEYKWNKYIEAEEITPG